MERLLEFLQTYKYKLILIGSILVGFGFIVIFLFLYTPGEGINNPFRTGTSLLSPRIQAISPANEARGVTSQSEFSITFTRALSENEKVSLQINGTPRLFFKKSWSTNNRKVMLNLTTPLASNTPYQVMITLNELQYVWTFITGSQITIPLDEQIENQTKSDKAYGDYVESIYDNYPWYNQLPIRTDSYFVYFSTDTKRFIGILYPDTQSPLLREDQIRNMQIEITARLRTLGINTDLFQFDWQVKENNKNVQ